MDIHRPLLPMLFNNSLRTAEQSPGDGMSRTCGTMSVHKRLLKTNQKYALARANIEMSAFGLARRQTTVARVGITTIPVVVHVVHNTIAQNISDAQIQSQIDALNLDFRRLNADVGNVPTAFSSLTADARIVFRLDAVNRVSTTVASFVDDDKVKAVATGGGPIPGHRIGISTSGSANSATISLVMHSFQEVHQTPMVWSSFILRLVRKEQQLHRSTWVVQQRTRLGIG